MSYLPLYLQQALPLISQHQHQYSVNNLVNNAVLELDIPRYYDEANVKYVEMYYKNDLLVKIGDAPYILVNNFNKMQKLMHYACHWKCEYVNTVQYLLDNYDVDVNLYYNNNKDHVLFCTQNTELLKLLIDNGADTSVEHDYYQSRYGYKKHTLLKHAIENKYSIDFILYLFDHGFEPTSKVLLDMCRNDYHVNDIKRFVEYSDSIGIDVLEYKSTNNETALMNARDIDTVRYLVERVNYDTEYINVVFNKFNDRTALIMLCWLPNPIEIVRYLVKYVTNINHYDSYRSNALIASIEHKQSFEVIQCLVEAGADIECTNSKGMTPLLMMCEKEYSLQNIQWMVEHGADINAVNEIGNTSLMYACFAKTPNIQVIQYLIDCAHNKDAFINYKRKDGSTAISLACDECNSYHMCFDVVRCLVENGADPNIKNNYDNCAINYACSSHKPIEVIQYLANRLTT